MKPFPQWRKILSWFICSMHAVIVVFWWCQATVGFAGNARIFRFVTSKDSLINLFCHLVWQFKYAKNILSYFFFVFLSRENFFFLFLNLQGLYYYYYFQETNKTFKISPLPKVHWIQLDPITDAVKTLHQEWGCKIMKSRHWGS